MADGFPELFDIRSFGRAMDQGFNQIVANYGETLEAIFLPVLKALVMMEKVLLWLPWWGVLLALAALAYAASRRWTVTVAVAVMTFCIGVIGVWEQAMATIALMVISTLLAVLVGLPIGIAMSRGKRMQAVTLPILDIMQTMPIFVYLIPFVMLFGPGKIPALLATIVFAIPPVIRLTNLGIRQVDAETVEAVRAFGASPLQILFSVQIPLAMPAILAGINQTTMMALSMVVIASMIGAGGLGYQVLQGIQRLEISSGLMAGLGIVLLAIIFDRIAQSYGQRMQKSLKLES
ncbi:MAG: ABC transporter permease [Rhodobacterales bacterium RIFCSPHIGHO2_02_FULL_62_130]|jgi:glycine betaine/proline transport system permease protein|nr:MAG: ABC transporter permease [Rhodobacterales bacterium RIFCSPHIGHO2_02_FULL_62_130]OHC54207.1 MAG: ABC transporter permease [Rhodobacterales bacterium RIFCSPHIGHO2_12_FULL_62_75]HCY99744.1 ABC transporter permease [Rhodobacter sp.]